MATATEVGNGEVGCHTCTAKSFAHLLYMKVLCPLIVTVALL